MFGLVKDAVLAEFGRQEGLGGSDRQAVRYAAAVSAVIGCGVMTTALVSGRPASRRAVANSVVRLVRMSWSLSPRESLRAVIMAARAPVGDLIQPIQDRQDVPTT
ncbi:hypothetical protein GCM10009555_064520 [Acrocarpospora macrocephala]